MWDYNTFASFFGQKISHFPNVHTFYWLSLAEKILSSYVIIVIKLRSGPLTTNSLEYS